MYKWENNKIPAPIGLVKVLEWEFWNKQDKSLDPRRNIVRNPCV